MTIFLSGWPAVPIPLVGPSDGSFVEAPQTSDLNVLSGNQTPDRASRLVVRYIVRNPFHLNLKMTAHNAHLTDTGAQAAVAALDAIFDATRYPAATKEICEGEEIVST